MVTACVGECLKRICNLKKVLEKIAYLHFLLPRSVLGTACEGECLKRTWFKPVNLSLGPWAAFRVHRVLVSVLIVGEAPAPGGPRKEEQQHHKDDEHHGQHDAHNHPDGLTLQGISERRKSSEKMSWMQHACFADF